MIVFYVALEGVFLLFGMMISKKLKDKADFFVCHVRFLEGFKQNLLFLQKSLFEYIEDISIVGNYKRVLESFKENFRNQDKDILLPDFLNLKEKEELNDFFGSLGVSDVSTQLDHLEKTLFVARQREKESQDKFKKYGGFSIKVSCLIGLALIIILL